MTKRFHGALPVALACFLALGACLGRVALALPPSPPEATLEDEKPPPAAPAPGPGVSLKKITGLEAPVDPALYTVVVGDVFTLALTRPGSQTTLKTIRVLPEGKVVLPFLGEMKAAGQRLDAFTKTVTERYRRAFPDVRVSFLLEDPGSFTVTALGAVVAPGQYEVNGLTRAAALLQLAGGVAAYGSERGLRLTQAGRESTLDMLRFREQGDLAHNPLLVPGAVLRAVPRHATVAVVGEVRVPGEYELAPGEGLKNLVELAKGFTPRADRGHVVLKRFVQSRDITGVWRRTVLDATGKDATQPLQDGDRIVVYPFDQAKGAFVTVEGLVKNPGKYPLDEGATLADVLYLAGGVQLGRGVREAFYFTRDEMGRAQKSRLDLSNYPDVDPLDLKPGDRLMVLDPDIQRGFVTVEGSVAIPGIVPWFDGLTAYDALQMAGGLKLNLSDSNSLTGGGTSFGALDLRNSFILRRVEKRGTKTDSGEAPPGEEEKILSLRLDKLVLDHDLAFNVPLVRGDRLLVAEQNDEVLVAGHVGGPGPYSFVANRPAIYYLRRAGMHQSADYDTIRVRKKNGQLTFGQEVVVYPGDEIEVEEKSSVRRTRKYGYYTGLFTSILAFSSIFNR